MTVKAVGDFSPMGPADGVTCVWQDDKGKVTTLAFDAILLRKIEID